MVTGRTVEAGASLARHLAARPALRASDLRTSVTSALIAPAACGAGAYLARSTTDAMWPTASVAASSRPAVAAIRLATVLGDSLGPHVIP